MYQSLPSAEEAAAAGFTPEDYASEPVDVFAENATPYALFCYMQTQWTYSMAGAMGLKYEVMHHKMDRMKLSAEDYEDLEADIRVMEFAALEEMHRKKT
jgi:hypothetical protein